MVGGTDNGCAAVGADESDAQCLAQSIRSADVCFICGHVAAIAASAADGCIAMVGPIMPDGIVQL